MTSFRHNLFSAGFACIAATRADVWLRPFASGRGVILTLHRVRPPTSAHYAPNRFLEITPDFLDTTIRMLRANRFDIIPLDDLLPRLRKASATRPFAVITFDDGYRDTLDIARPILKRHAAPWTLFAAPEYLAGNGRLWWIELEEAIGRLERCTIDLDGREQSWPTRTDAEKNAAYRTIRSRLHNGPLARRHSATEALAAAADLDAATLTRAHCAGWEDLLALSADPDVTIGSHTVRHPVLSHCTDAEATFEIAASKMILERKLGRSVRHLAYPHGDKSSAGRREFALAANNGYETALTTRPAHLFPADLQTPHALPRIPINGLYQSPAALRALLSGVPFMPAALGSQHLSSQRRRCRAIVRKTATRLHMPRATTRSRRATMWRGPGERPPSRSRPKWPLGCGCGRRFCAEAFGREPSRSLRRCRSGARCACSSRHGRCR